MGTKHERSRRRRVQYDASVQQRPISFERFKVVLVNMTMPYVGSRRDRA